MPKYDLLIVGGGPAGSAAGFWAAKNGMSVAILEKKQFPREKTCGDGLTPRAIHQLEEMGALSKLDSSHRHIGLRTLAGKYSLELEWPDHPEFPNYGLSIRRREFDKVLIENAQAQGATVYMQTEAMGPLWTTQDENKTSSPIKGAKIQTAEGELDEIHADFVIVADGANSRFGRALGTSREKNWPQGMAIRTYYESSNHKDEWLESNIDIRDKLGNSMPGYGWIFPLGDGTINVGIGILSTFKNYKDLNTSHLMERWAEAVDERWGIDPASPCIAPVGGRLPMGGSVSPKAGENWLLIGDAAGFINPFNGEGIDYALETGRYAAEIIGSDSNQNLMQHYPDWLEENYGLYFRVGRAFAKVIGRPAVMKNLIGVGMRSKSLMEWALRIMSNMLRPDEKGTAELAYGAMVAALKITRPKAGSTLN